MRSFHCWKRAGAASALLATSLLSLAAPRPATAHQESGGNGGGTREVPVVLKLAGPTPYRIEVPAGYKAKVNKEKKSVTARAKLTLYFLLAPDQGEADITKRCVNIKVVRTLPTEAGILGDKLAAPAYSRVVDGKPDTSLPKADFDKDTGEIKTINGQPMFAGNNVSDIPRVKIYNEIRRHIPREYLGKLLSDKDEVMPRDLAPAPTPRKPDEALILAGRMHAFGDVLYNQREARGLAWKNVGAIDTTKFSAEALGKLKGLRILPDPDDADREFTPPALESPEQLQKYGRWYYDLMEGTLADGSPARFVQVRVTWGLEADLDEATNYPIVATSVSAEAIAKAVKGGSEVPASTPEPTTNNATNFAGLVFPGLPGNLTAAGFLPPARPGLDIVAGYAAAADRPTGLVGVNLYAKRYAQEEDQSPNLLHKSRLGLFVGAGFSGDNGFVLGPTLKVNQFGSLFAGAIFREGNGATRSGLAFGVVLSLAPILSPTPAPAPSTVLLAKVTAENGALTNVNCLKETHAAIQWRVLDQNGEHVGMKPFTYQIKGVATPVDVAVEDDQTYWLTWVQSDGTVPPVLEKVTYDGKPVDVIDNSALKAGESYRVTITLGANNAPSKAQMGTLKP